MNKGEQCLLLIHRILRSILSDSSSLSQLFLRVSVWTGVGHEVALPRWGHLPHMEYIGKINVDRHGVYEVTVRERKESSLRVSRSSPHKTYGMATKQRRSWAWPVW